MSRKKKPNRFKSSRLSQGRTRENPYGPLEQAVILDFALGKEIPALCEKYSLTKRQVNETINRYKQIQGISEIGPNEREWLQGYKEDLLEIRKYERALQWSLDFIGAGNTFPKDLTDADEIYTYLKENGKDSLKSHSSYEEIINLLRLDEEMD